MIYAWGDPADRFLAADKVEHLMGGMLVGTWLWLVGDSLALALLGTFIAGVVVEVIELLRYRAWVAKSRPQPWPWLTDLISPKDLVVDVVGGLLGWCAAGLLVRIGAWL